MIAATTLLLDRPTHRSQNSPAPSVALRLGAAALLLLARRPYGNTRPWDSGLPKRWSLLYKKGVASCRSSFMSTIPAFANGWQQATRYPDPAIVALDPRFEKYWIKLSCVERLCTGCAGRKARSGSATAAICSGATSPTTASCAGRRRPARSASSAGPPTTPTATRATARAASSAASTARRRVTRTEHDGTITVIMDSYEGKRLNSPNDVVVQSDGSIWFTDPSYGIIADYEGYKATPEIDATSTASTPRRQSSPSPPRACSGPTASASRPTRRSSTSSRAAACRTASSSLTTSPTAAASSPTSGSISTPAPAARPTASAATSTATCGAAGHGLARARRRHGLRPRR